MYILAVDSQENSRKAPVVAITLHSDNLGSFLVFFGRECETQTYDAPTVDCVQSCCGADSQKVSCIKQGKSSGRNRGPKRFGATNYQSHGSKILRVDVVWYGVNIPVRTHTVRVSRHSCGVLIVFIILSLLIIFSSNLVLLASPACHTCHKCHDICQLT